MASAAAATRRRTLLLETPYVCVLNDEQLQHRCSKCFQRAKTPCDKCYTAVYCNEDCASADRPWHELECSLMPTLDSSDVRLIARFAYRWRKDGGVAKLCDKFPANVKDRTCKDLMSHFRDMKKDKRRKETMEEVWAAWQKHMMNTSLGTMKKDEVLRLFCTLCINTFGIYDYGIIDQEAPWTMLGVGLYLNASRFNHSCCPHLAVTFDGIQMQVECSESLPVGKNGTISENKFNRLTINYGVPGNELYGPYIPLASQRIASLQMRYYFKCRCSWCSDKITKLLEENAAVNECKKCGWPYVWRGRSMKLRPVCACKEKSVKPELMERLVAKELGQTWDQVMSDTEWEINVDKVIERCQPLWLVAKQYWHPVANLRLGQLNERLFRSCLVKAASAEEAVRSNYVQLALAAGESMLAAYSTRITNDPQMGVFCCQMAAAYELAKGNENIKKAYQYYTKAIGVFQHNQDQVNASITLKWRQNLNMVEDGEAVIS